jgi:hypothetical protein
MTRKILLGVLTALCTAAASQPAAAQWYDRWDRGGFGVSVGFGASPGWYDYGYAGYDAYAAVGPRCSCAPAAGYAYSAPRTRYVRDYAYADDGYASYGYAGLGYSDYAYASPGYGYVSVDVGIRDRSWRTSRIDRSIDRRIDRRVSRTDARFAVRDRDFDRGAVRTRGAARAEFAGESGSRRGALAARASAATEGRGMGARIQGQDYRGRAR